MKKQSQNDPVVRPSHYHSPNTTRKGEFLEVLDVARAWNFHKNAYLFNVLKYLLRSDSKGDPKQDLKKLRQYVDFELDEMERAEGNSTLSGEETGTIELRLVEHTPFVKKVLRRARGKRGGMSREAKLAKQRAYQKAWRQKQKKKKAKKA